MKLAMCLFHQTPSLYSVFPRCLKNVILQLVGLNQDLSIVHTLHWVDVSMKFLGSSHCFLSICSFLNATYLLKKVGHLSCRISQILDLAECNLALICDVILCTPACFLQTCIVVFISIWVCFSLWQECVIADASVSPQEAPAVRLSHFQLR